MSCLEQAISNLNRAQSAEQAFIVFSTAMQDFGYDRLSYTLCTDHPSLGLPKQHGLSTSYPEDWMRHYKGNNYLRVDPVVRELLKLRQPFFWDDIIEAEDKDSPSYTLMREAEDAEITDGIGIALSTPYGETTGVGIARSTRLNEKHDYDLLAKIYFLTVCFHETYRDLLSRAEVYNLTEKEKEVLCWAAEGKVDDDISILMNVSFNTIRFHWKNIFKKLNTFNKVHAVSKALRLKLIVPGVVTY